MNIKDWLLVGLFGVVILVFMVVMGRLGFAGGLVIALFVGAFMEERCKRRIEELEDKLEGLEKFKKRREW